MKKLVTMLFGERSSLRAEAQAKLEFFRNIKVDKEKHPQSVRISRTVTPLNMPMDHWMAVGFGTIPHQTAGYKLNEKK